MASGQLLRTWDPQLTLENSTIALLSMDLEIICSLRVTKAHQVIQQMLKVFLIFWLWLNTSLRRDLVIYIGLKSVNCFFNQV